MAFTNIKGFGINFEAFRFGMWASIAEHARGAGLLDLHLFLQSDLLSRTSGQVRELPQSGLGYRRAIAPRKVP